MPTHSSVIPISLNAVSTKSLTVCDSPVIEVPIKYNHVEGSKFNVSTMVLGGFISALAFRIRMSPFGKFIPKTLYELYYRKFRWI